MYLRNTLITLFKNKTLDNGKTATSSTTYNGFTTTTTNPLGHQKTTTKNAIGKIIRIDEPKSAWLTHQIASAFDIDFGFAVFISGGVLSANGIVGSDR
jgi:hypothetical protein